MKKVKYVAKEGTWFDQGTEVELVEGPWDKPAPMKWGLFCGLRNGKEDEETCSLDEFEVIEYE